MINNKLKQSVDFGLLRKTGILTFGLTCVFSTLAMAAPADETSVSAPQVQTGIVDVRQINPTTVEVILNDNRRMTFDFYGDNIFRLFRDDNGGILRAPKAEPEATILVQNPRKPLSKLELNKAGDKVTLSTGKIRVELDKKTALFKVHDLEKNKVAFEQTEPISIEKNRAGLSLKSNPNEYYYGGGVQNGRFSHKGKIIAIENQNSWTDGGVASPAPFYWSTDGYGVMWHTFKKGQYDLGASEADKVKLHHEDNYLDMFFMVNDGAVPLLNDFYQLTGNPVFMPKFAFYQGHLNAYNRDYWKEDENGILFEDGKRYKESQKDNGGIKESLNGELPNNYQFSARAVIDRYKAHDMPLGWILPNDGYGAGYGQTETIDGNIANLKEFGDYARKNGVEIGLWTESNLHPRPDVSALLQRDIVKEVRDAGVRVLKTDVAWVGAGYSFGLNGVTDTAEIMTYYGDDARPFIISLDGWAGTQRYAGIWSGDQTGGEWEYIRFHIPTYIGSGLSGQPNISSDMDGIFGGKNLFVNTRDFQWKTFTPMELNMDGWGANEKYPHALGEPATSINRWYLKMKSELMPYAYSIAEEAITGKPMIRALFLDYPNTYTLGHATQYEFLYGPYFLVAPIYQATKMDEKGNDVRDNIYLPEGQWIDYFNGDLYEGGKIYNNFDAPVWKLPVFVKNGAIIPLANPNNNVSEINEGLRIVECYPYGESSFTVYDDDGKTMSYLKGQHAKTLVTSKAANGSAVVTLHPTKGSFNGFVKDKATELRINVTQKPESITASVNGKNVELLEVESLDDFNKGQNVYFYDAKPNLNKFATKGSDFEKEVITKNPQALVKLAPTDITVGSTVLTVKGFKFAPADSYVKNTGALATPSGATLTEENTGAYTLKPTWKKVDNADYYEIKFKDMLYTTIKGTELLFEDLVPETEYAFQLRAVNRDGKSDWASFTAKTASNPLEFAIPNIVGSTDKPNQGNSLRRLFDHEEGDTWHTKYQKDAMPLELVMDLQTINKLDKFHYVPREDAGNGTLLKGTISYSIDRENWVKAGTFDWQKDGEVKIYNFKDAPSARYIKLNITEAVGNYGSGKELYVFKVPGTESYIPGDINNDGKIDSNDLTSYMNYTGLRQGDSDFEGYISNGDINKNGLIDAYDISNVTTKLQGGVDAGAVDKLEGTLDVQSDKKEYKKGEEVLVKVSGKDLKSVNALSFALPYNAADYDYVGVEAKNMGKMENLTKDRLHTNGQKALYPTFSNIGKEDALEGSNELFILKLKAKRDVKADFKPIDGILVDKNLNTKKL